MFTYDEWLQILTDSVDVRVCAGLNPRVQFDQKSLDYSEFFIFKSVFYSSLYKCREILKQSVVHFSSCYTEAIYLSDTNDCKYNDDCMCSWYSGLLQLTFENDGVRQACVSFLINSAPEIGRQLLGLELIDLQQGSNFLVSCNCISS